MIENGGIQVSGQPAVRVDMTAHNPLRRFIDWLFGYDFFISYAHDDGKEYPRHLYDELESRRYRTFLDARVYVPGDELNASTRRRVAMSSYLVVVCGAEALTSEWVRREVDIALKHKRKVTVVNVNDTFSKAEPKNELRKLLDTHLRIEEKLDSGSRERPVATAEALIGGFHAVRQETRRLRVAVALIALFATLSVLSFQLYRRTDHQRQEITGLYRVSEDQRGKITQLYRHSERQRQEIAQALSRSEFRLGALSLEANGLPGAINHFTRAVTADPSYAAAVDRLYTLITQRPSWRLMRRLEFASTIKRFVLSPDSQWVAVELENGQISFRDWEGRRHQPSQGSPAWWAADRSQAETLAEEAASESEEDDEQRIEVDHRISPDRRWRSWVLRDLGNFQAVEFPRDSVQVAAVGDAGDTWATGESFPDEVRVEHTAFDPTSSHFAVTLSNGWVRIMHPRRGPTNMAHEGVEWTGFDSTGTVAYTVSPGETRLWSIPDGALLGTIPTGRSEGSVTFLRDQDHWFVISIDSHSISLWSARIATGAVASVSTASAPNPGTWSRRSKDAQGGRWLEESEPGTWAIVDAAGTDKRLPKLSFPLSEEAIRLIDEHNETFTNTPYPMTDAAISADGTTVVTVAGERAPAVWKVGESSPRRTLEIGAGEYTKSVVVDRDGARAMIRFSVTESDKTQYYAVHTLNDGHRIREWSIDPDQQEELLDVSHGFLRMIVREGSRIVVRDTADYHEIGLPITLDGQICGATFSEDGRSFVAASTDGTVRVWDVETSVPLSELLVSPPKIESTCHPWFSDQDRRVHLHLVNRPAETSESAKLLTWKVRITVTSDEAKRLAVLSRQLVFPQQTVSALRTEFAGSWSPDLTQLIQELLADVLPRPTQR